MENKGDEKNTARSPIFFIGLVLKKEKMFFTSNQLEKKYIGTYVQLIYLTPEASGSGSCFCILFKRKNVITFKQKHPVYYANFLEDVFSIYHKKLTHFSYNVPVLISD